MTKSTSNHCNMIGSKNDIDTGQCNIGGIFTNDMN